MMVSAPFSRACLAARNRRVDEAEAEFCGFRVQLARYVGGGGRVIDEDRARLHAREGAARSQRDRAQIIVVSDAGENEITPRSRFTRGRSARPAMPVDPAGRLGRSSVVDDDAVAGGRRDARPSETP